MIIDFGERKFEAEGNSEGTFFTVYDDGEWVKLKVIDSSGDITIVNE